VGGHIRRERKKKVMEERKKEHKDGAHTAKIYFHLVVAEVKEIA